MPKGIPLTHSEITRRRKDIVKASVPLFLEQGFPETSMRAIARAAGTGKSTLYDYFASKDDILVFYLRDSVDQMLDRAKAVLRSGGSVRARLEGVMHTHLAFLLENRALLLRLSFEAQRLSPESQARVQAKRYEYQDLLQALIEEGIANGEFRPVNGRMAMKTLLALMTPVVYTSRPAGTPEEMLASGIDLILNGLTP